MRKLDIIANERFNGDIKKTIKYLMFDAGPNAFDEHVDYLTKEEGEYAVGLIEAVAIEHYGNEENFRKEIKKNANLDSLNLTEAEILSAPVNPYKAEILKNFYKLLTVNGSVILLSTLLNPAAASLGIVATISTGIFSSLIADNIIKYVKFKNTKKIIMEQQNDLDKKMLGR